MESEKGKLQAQIKKAAQLGDVVPRSYLLGLLTRARNGEMYLRRVEFAVVEFEASASESSSGTRRTQSSSAGRSPKTPKVKAPMRKLIRIRVDGYASNSAEISQFHQALKREPMIENIEQGYSRGVLIDKKPWINFDLMMEVPLDGDTPLVKRGGGAHEFSCLTASRVDIPHPALCRPRGRLHDRLQTAREGGRAAPGGGGDQAG